MALNFITPYWRHSKTLIVSSNVDQKSIETEFSIAICRPFLAIFDPRSSIVKCVFDCRLSIVYMTFFFMLNQKLYFCMKSTFMEITRKDNY